MYLVPRPPTHPDFFSQLAVYEIMNLGCMLARCCQQFTPRVSPCLVEQAMIWVIGVSLDPGSPTQHGVITNWITDLLETSVQIPMASLPGLSHLLLPCDLHAAKPVLRPGTPISLQVPTLWCIAKPHTTCFFYTIIYTWLFRQTKVQACP